MFGRFHNGLDKPNKGSNTADMDKDKTIALQIGPIELEIIRTVLEHEHKKGSRINQSSLIRWAIRHAPYDQMERVY